MNSLSIGEIGKQVGLPTKTIRYYEGIGLIEKANRGENGYRMYPEQAITELSVIKNARDLGLPIQEIKKLMKGCEDGTCEHTKTYVENEINAYIQILDKKIAEMQLLKDQLFSLKEDLDFDKEACDEFCCNILGQLMNISKGGEK